MTIDGENRQTVHAGFHFFDHRRIRGKSLRLLGQVVTLDADTLISQPLEVGGELG